MDRFIRNRLGMMLRAVIAIALASMGASCAAERVSPMGGNDHKQNQGSPPRLAACIPESQDAELNTSALKVLLRAEVPLLVLDARSAEFDDGRRIPGAKQLSPKAAEEEAAALIKSKDQLIVTYCNNPKCPASRNLFKRLKEFGYKNVIEYPYGIQGWVKAGNKYEMVENFVHGEVRPAAKRQGSASK